MAETGKTGSISGSRKKPPKTTTVKADDSSTMNVTDKSKQMVTQNDEKRTVLAQAKDRAQLTSIIAMSIVNVALLKAVIDQGHENNRYYHATLSLIITSLALQVLSGILSMMITNIQSYYNSYSDDLCEDFVQNLCCCQFKKRKKGSTSAVYKIGGGVSDHTTETEHEHGSGQPTEDAEVGGRCCPCIPVECTTSVYSDYEYDILDKYDYWNANLADFELHAVQAESEIKYVQKIIDTANQSLKLLQASLDEGTGKEDPEDLKSRMAAITQQIVEAQERITKCAECRTEVDVVKEQGDLLFKYVDAIRKNRVLKQVAFWQNMLNYILYAVFILNAFITGLGLAATPTAPLATPDDSAGIDATQATNVASQ